MGVESAIVDSFGMQLQIDPAVDTDGHYALHISRPWPKSQAVERMQSTLSIGRTGRQSFLLLLPGQQWLDTTRHADRKQKNSDFGAARKHEGSGQEKSLLIINPTAGKSCCPEELPKYSADRP